MTTTTSALLLQPLLVAFLLLTASSSSSAYAASHSSSSPVVRGVSKNNNHNNTATSSSTQSSSSSPPIVTIGILSQPDRTYEYHYIAKSYVDWVTYNNHTIAVPIPYDASPQLIDHLFPQLDGVLLPGGWNGYMPPSVPYLLDKIVQSNQQQPQRYVPVFGICLGYEFLIQYIGGTNAIQTGFDSYNTSLPLHNVYRQELYADSTIYNTVTTTPVTMNNHKLGIEPSHFLQNPKLTAVWNITSINHDSHGRPFVSTIEPNHPTKFPLYGVQYHPEKNGFEYTTIPGTNNMPYENIDHSPSGIEFSIYMSQFFVNKVRYGRDQQQQQSSKYTTKSESTQERYPPITDYPLRTGMKLERVYVIPFASHWDNDEEEDDENHNDNTTVLSTREDDKETTTTTTTIPPVPVVLSSPDTVSTSSSNAVMLQQLLIATSTLQ